MSIHSPTNQSINKQKGIHGHPFLQALLQRHRYNPDREQPPRKPSPVWIPDDRPTGSNRSGTRKGFSRDFELDVGGFVDSSSEEDEAEAEEEEEEETVEKGGFSPPSSTPPLPSTPSPPITADQNEDDDDEITVIDSVLPSRPLSPRPVGPTTTTKKRKRRLSKLRKYGLTFGCSSCLRPLVLHAQSPSRRIYALSCGHLVDGYCLSRLSAPPYSTYPLAYPLPPDLAPDPKGKGKGKLPPVPKERTYEWVCPVEGCEKAHGSDLELFVDRQTGDVGVFLEGPQWCWRARVGSDGVGFVYV